eukprot:TRINITY_DN20971_c0_g2_i3.p1 TRINITY_DN20971_c0_g2~~TRINITY_DN20971_c0_g2_i3.p1  ORF type:complete len:243 (-),score=23.01 TRINITY_DN20971_c0_g2_i3:122-781(-)
MTNIIDDMNIYSAGLRVRNTFYELYIDEPKIRRCSSEPAVCLGSEPKGTLRVPLTPGFDLSQKHAASIVTSATPSNGCEFVGPSMPSTEKHCMMALLNLDPRDTTIMVRDLPCKVGHERMMAEMKSIGLDGCYDLLYCPKSTRDRSSFKGFCFINFMTREALKIFVFEFANHRFEDMHSEKVVHFDRADIQGRSANVAHLRSSRNRVVFRSDAAGLRAN